MDDNPLKATFVEEDFVIDKSNVPRSIFVTGFSRETNPDNLIIHFQRQRNGGGDIESIMINREKGAAVITFDNEEVVQSVQQQKQEVEGATLSVKPYDAVLKKDEDFEVFERVSAKFRVETLKIFSREQIKSILKEISSDTGAECHEKSNGFIISGSFEQIKESRSCLQQRVYLSSKSGGNAVSNGAEKEVPLVYDENGSYSGEDNREGASRVIAEKSKLAPKEKASTDDTSKLPPSTSASSVAPSPQFYETTLKFMTFLFKAYGDDLKEMEKKYQVALTRKDKENKTYVYVVPGEACTIEEHENACDSFITLYQRLHQNMRFERFSLKSEKTIVHSRQEISEIGKKFPVLVEVTSDRKHWELYGEKDVVEAALKDLEKNVGIKREDTGSGNVKTEKRKPRGSRGSEEAMDVDPPSSAVAMRNRLETTIGKVKLSVYKNDITNEHVNVIVNAANDRLDHIGGVAKAILDRGGWSIQDESNKIVKNKGRLRVGDAVATGAGNLQCKIVVHAVGPEWYKVGATNSENYLRRACLNSFRVTQDHEMTSVALPAIGSGIFGMPKDVCAEVMFEAVEEFVRLGDPKTKTITDIRFVNIDDPTVQAFKEEFMKRYAGNQDDRPIGGNEGSREEESAGNPDNPTRGKGGKGKNLDTSGGSTEIGALIRSGQHDNYSGSHGNASVTYIGHEKSKSYSAVVKGKDGIPEKKNEKDGEHFSSPGDADKADYASGGASSAPECPICLDTMKKPRTLKCGHAFCSECLGKALKVSNTCPVCKAPQGALKGSQPNGQMNVRHERYLSVPGYEANGRFTIHYSFSSGTQGPEHPNPGQRYEGTARTAYLPDTREGNEVLQLLRRAFDARLVFTIGTSITTGRPNQVTWNDIHHKTNVYGGPEGFGYPDPNYLRRVKEDLAAKGIR